jgi:hypothetical protein
VARDLRGGLELVALPRNHARSLSECSVRAAHDPDLRPGWWWSAMAQFWIDVVSILVVCTIVFMLVQVCERERH